MSVHLRPFVSSLWRHKLMYDIGLRCLLATLTRRNHFGTTLPWPEKHPPEYVSHQQMAQNPMTFGDFPVLDKTR